MKCLSALPSKMMTVEELADATGIVTYDKAFIFRKHVKRSFLTGKHAFPIYIKHPPPGTSPSLKKELTVVILRHDSEVATFEKAVKWQKEITQKYSSHTLEPNFPEMKNRFRLFQDKKSKILGKKESSKCKICPS